MLPRTVFRSAAAVLALTALAACSGGSSADDAADGTQDTATDTTLNVALDGTVTCLDPYQTDTPAQLNIYRQEVETLTRLDPATGELQPWLATAWQAAPDATSFDFTLREGVSFSDGTPLTAEVVAQNFDASVALGAKAVRASGYLTGYTGTTVTGENTFTVTFDRSNASFLNHTASIFLSILAPDTLAKSAEERCADGVLGTGPFVQESFSRDENVVLTRREDYDWAPEWAGRTGSAAAQEIVFSFVEESGTRTGLLTSGQADVIQSIATVDIPLAEESGASTGVAQTPGIPSRLQVNVQRPVLADEAVRQAIRWSVDREEVSETVFDGLAPVADGLLTSTVPGRVAFPDLLAHDPAAAADLLDAAGWTLGADGVRAKDGVRLAFTITSASPYSSTQSVMELLEQQLRAVGFDVTLRNSTTAEFTDMVARHDYDVLFSNTTDVDADVLRSQLAPDQGNRANLSADDPIGPLLTQQSVTGDTTARNAILAQVQEQVLTQAYQIPVVPLVQVYGIGAGVEGVAFDAESRLFLYAAAGTA